MIYIDSSGGRLHAENQAARLRNVADELERDLNKAEKTDGLTWIKAKERIEQHRADAAAFDAAISAYDERHRNLTQGEIDSMVKP